MSISIVDISRYHIHKIEHTTSNIANLTIYHNVRKNAYVITFNDLYHISNHQKTQQAKPESRRNQYSFLTISTINEYSRKQYLYHKNHMHSEY